MKVKQKEICPNCKYTIQKKRCPSQLCMRAKVRFKEYMKTRQVQ